MTMCMYVNTSVKIAGNASGILVFIIHMKVFPRFVYVALTAEGLEGGSSAVHSYLIIHHFDLFLPSATQQFQPFIHYFN